VSAVLQNAPATRPRYAHVWAKDLDGFYIEPEWVSERLFAVEQFTGSIWDPFCGGPIAESARAAGYPTIATDRIDRG
jgi:hypothetical protein